MGKYTGLLLILLGIAGLIFAASFIYQRNTPSRLAFRLTEIKSVETTQKIRRPTIIRIPTLDLELPIVPTKLENSRWQATSEGVSYLTTTPQPGESGNSIMYGHNWPNLLGRLKQVKPGQIIEVLFSDGNKSTFEIAFTTVVTPDQTHILNQTDDRRLTLYTCTGFLDSKRFVVTAISS